MLSVVDEQVTFLGIPSSTPEREFLRQRGFLHVTGILVNVQGLLCRIGDQLRLEDCGRWDTYGGMTAVITSGGEIWLRAGTYHLHREEERYLMLRGRGGPVPLSGQNEITFAHRELLARVIDPYAGLTLPE